MSEVAIELITNAAQTFVNKELSAKRIPSSQDVFDNLILWLNTYEKVHGNIIQKAEFVKVCEKIIILYMNANTIYRYGDWNSFYTLVREKNLVSTLEHARRTVVSGINCGIVNRSILASENTEFPLDNNGYYIKPK